MINEKKKKSLHQSEIKRIHLILSLETESCHLYMLKLINLYVKIN